MHMQKTRGGMTAEELLPATELESSVGNAKSRQNDLKQEVKRLEAEVRQLEDTLANIRDSTTHISNTSLAQLELLRHQLQKDLDDQKVKLQRAQQMLAR